MAVSVAACSAPPKSGRNVYQVASSGSTFRKQAPALHRSQPILRITAQQKQTSSGSNPQDWSRSRGRLALQLGVSAAVGTGLLLALPHSAGGQQAVSPCRALGSNGSGGSGSGGEGNGGWGNGGGGGGGNGASGDANVGVSEKQSTKTAGGEEVILLDISGMKCGGCVGRVKKLLEEVPEVSSASVNLATETALVRVLLASNDSKSPSDALEELRATLCSLLSKVGFITTVREQGANSNSAASRVVAAKRAEREQRLADTTRRLMVAGALASTCFLHHLAHFFPGAPAWLKLLGSTPVHAGLATAALLGPGRHILVDGFKALREGAPDMNSLVGLGAVASFGMSCVAMALPRLGWSTFFEEPAMLMGVVLLGKTLEERAKLAASSDMASLQTILPSMARLLLEGGATRDVPSDMLQPGDVVSVRPGDRIPVDGVVASGVSTVNEAALTGEPLPVTKSQGSEIMAGTINVDGALMIRASACGDKTAIADVIRLVEEAQSRTAPVQRLADRVSGVFAYGVMGASLATLVFWATAGTRLFPQVLSSKIAAAACGAPGAATAAGAAVAAGGSALGAKLLLSLQLACNVLVVACPCALGLATPTAVLVGTSAAARKGLLIRGGDVLETTSSVDTVVFDKTGTLTSGKPIVTQVSLAPEFEEAQVMSYVAGVEANSTHPLATAIVAHSSNGGFAPADVDDGSFVQEPGSGARATVNGSTVAVGNAEWLQRHGVTIPASTTASAETETAGATHIYVAICDKFAGELTLRDEVRAGSVYVVEKLRQMGVEPVMLSGDTQAAAQAIGTSLGISPENIYGGVKPAGKADVITRLKAEGKKVAMVGDGVNDTAALALADVGIAMGGGVDAASEVADIVLLGDRVPQVLDAIHISQATFNKIRQNLWWAFGYNLVGIPVAAGALLPAFGIALTPSVSGAVMAFSSVAVMGNSLLLQLEADRVARRNEVALEQAEPPKALSPANSSVEVVVAS